MQSSTHHITPRIGKHARCSRAAVEQELEAQVLSRDAAEITELLCKLNLEWPRPLSRILRCPDVLHSRIA